VVVGDEFWGIVADIRSETCLTPHYGTAAAGEKLAQADFPEFIRNCDLKPQLILTRIDATARSARHNRDFV
jgi:hypothetical protein